MGITVSNRTDLIDTEITVVRGHVKGSISTSEQFVREGKAIESGEAIWHDGSASGSVLLLGGGWCLGQSPPLAITPPLPGPLVVSYAKIQAGAARFDVLNAAKTAQAITPAITGPFAANGTWTGGPLEIAPVTPVAAGEMRTFQVLPLKAAPAPGTYSAQLRLLVNGLDAIAPQPIIVIVATTDLARTKDALALFRWFPFSKDWWLGLWEKPLTIPLAGGGVLAGTPGHAIGAVGRDAGGWTQVRWDQSGKQLVVDSPANPGTYSGDLVLATDPARVPYTLTVIAKDAILVPILVIAIGIALAYGAKRYIGVLRVDLQLRLQEAELGPQFRRAQAQFESSTTGQAFGAYSIADDVKKLRRQLLAAIRAVEKTAGTTIDPNDKNFQNALSDLAATTIRHRVLAGVRGKPSGAFEGPGGSADLDQGCGYGTSASRPDRARGSLAPQRWLLQGKAISLSDLAGLIPKVTAFGALAEIWPAARQRAANLTAELRELKALPNAASQQIDLDTAQNAVVDLWVGLNSGSGRSEG